VKPDYSDYDTEQVRKAQYSSEGMQTQQLHHSEPVHAYAPVGQPHSSATPTNPLANNNLLALVLIVIGSTLFFRNLLPSEGEVTAGMILFTIASPFLFFAFWKNIYGLLIPGSILAGLSVGVTFASLTNGASVLFGLALGFATIFFTGNIWFQIKNPWPLIPAAILFAVGSIITIASVPFLGGIFGVFPILLIVAGLYLGWRNRIAPNS
jgi:hypothetical protein